jgi:flavin reductase ActVB
MITAAQAMVEPAAYRNAMARFASGVTVVTTRDDAGHPYGFTASSFCPVSMDPPLILVCIGRSARAFDAFYSCERFVVSILADQHREMAERFGRGLADKFGPGGVTATRDGLPAVRGALAVIECESAGRYDAGDHVILMGLVYRLQTTPGRPIIYSDRSFGRFHPAHREDFDEDRCRLEESA